MATSTNVNTLSSVMSIDVYESVSVKQTCRNYRLQECLTITVLCNTGEQSVLHKIQRSVKDDRFCGQNSIVADGGDAGFFSIQDGASLLGTEDVVILAFDLVRGQVC
jgi:hypothetical protein